MIDASEFALEETGTLHLKDKAGNLKFTPDGQPVQIVLYSPGTKQYAKAQAAANNRTIDRIKKKGKSDQSAEDMAAEKAEFLASVTQSFVNLGYGDLKEKALFKAVYSDDKLVVIRNQVDEYLTNFENF